MSPVDKAGSVSKISPRHSFLYKNFDACVHMRRRGGPVTEISVFATEILLNGLEICSHKEHSSPDTVNIRDETFSTAHGL